MMLAEYWTAVDEELSGLPARPVLTPVPARSTPRFTGYEVRLTSLSGYRIFGYLSVPTGPGPFPGLLETPRHGSVNHPPHHHDRLRYVVFTVMHRGQRRADEPFTAGYPGLFTHGIEDPAGYVYRGIVADCLRAAEFLHERPEVDPTAVVATGDELALLTAARRPGFSALRVADLLFYRALDARGGTVDYPLEELNDHLRAHPGAEGALRRTLSFFDPAWHAPAVRARTLLSLDRDPQWYGPLLAALGERAETYRLSHEAATDDDARDAWLAARLGVEPMPRYLRRPA
jgi:cephalosporin-C deacetylase